MILSIDYGQKRIGLAIGRNKIASPLKIIQNNGLERVVEKLTSIIEEEEIDAIVLGQPQVRDRNSRKLLTDIRGLVALLHERFPSVQIVLFNESHTSKEAEDVMIELGTSPKSRRTPDAFAAMVLLKRYFEEKP